VNRKTLAIAAPPWITIQSFPAQMKFDMLAMWIEAITDSIELDHLEPDSWEALYLTYAVHALVKGKYFGALRFGEMALIDPSMHRPARLHADGPEPVTLAELRHAMELARDRPANR